MLVYAIDVDMLSQQSREETTSASPHGDRDQLDSSHHSGELLLGRSADFAWNVTPLWCCAFCVKK